MRPFTFVHAADLHLDSPFVGIQDVDEDIAERLREATFSTFRHIVDLCIEREVNFLLVAGDIYDSRDRSLRAQIRFRDGLRRLSAAGIPAFVVHGNHDPLDTWSATLQWPEDAHIFGGETVTRVPVEAQGGMIATVYGISYPTQEVRDNLATGFRRDEKDVYAIGLLHCNVGENTGHEPYASCSVEDLVRAGMDYWALGHVHNRRIIREDKPVIVYPGNPQGRNVREAGTRGCYLVHVDSDGRCTPEFVSVDAIRWFPRHLPIEDMRDDEGLLSAIDTLLRSIREQAGGRTCICRIWLQGRGSIHDTLNRGSVLDDVLGEARDAGKMIEPIVWVDRIEDNTRPTIDVDARRAGQDFVGDLLRLIDRARRDPELRDSLLTPELQLLFDSSSVSRLLEHPTEEDLPEWIDAAETLCLDMLVREEE